MDSHSRRFASHNIRMAQTDQPEDVAAQVIEFNPLATGDYDDSDRSAHETPSDVRAVPNQNRGVGDRELGVGYAEFREGLDDDLVNRRLGGVVHSSIPENRFSLSNAFVSGDCSENECRWTYRQEQKGPSQERLPLQRVRKRHDPKTRRLEGNFVPTPLGNLPLSSGQG